MGKKEPEQLFQPDLHTYQKIKLSAFLLCGVLFLSLFFSSCANKGVITGGEKDTIPPQLMSSVPFNQSLNYKGTELVLTFDERVQAPQLKRKLLITPFTDVPYKIKINRNIVQLSFEKSFNDSTTYTLNFADAITDVTENNPAQNVTIAFSTWHIIDSLSIFGKIVNLMSDQPVEAAAISVYQANDTLDIFSGKPYYFSFTDKQGRFFIQNMKAGYYRIYAFKDENSNYLNEPASEAHGFIPDTVLIRGKSDSLKIPLILQDVQDLKFVNTRSNGNHFDIRYNKYIDSYLARPIDSIANPFHHIISTDHAFIRFFNNGMNETDSLAYQLNVSDSTGNRLTDTLFVKFNDRKIRQDKFEMFITPSNNSSIKEKINLHIKFNKPVTILNADSILVKYDTLKTVTVDSINHKWNSNRSELSFSLQLDRSYLPAKIQEHQKVQDSLALLDSLNNVPIDSAKLSEKPPRKINPDKVNLYFGQGAFISVENDSSQLANLSYTFGKPEKFGKISGEIQIDSVHFIVQLINEKYQKIREVANQRKYLFDFIPPGKYNIRVLIDTNGDGVWSYGNIRHGTPPEGVYFHPTFIELRENWEITNINLSINTSVNKL